MAKKKNSKKSVKSAPIIENALPQNILPIGERVEEDKNIYISQPVSKEIHKFTQNKTTNESGGMLIGNVIEEFGKTNQEKFAQVPFEVHELTFDQQVNPYGMVFENFAAHILQGTPLAANGMDGLRQVQLANAVYVSGWEEKKVSIPVAEEQYLSGLKLRQEMEKA